MTSATIVKLYVCFLVVVATGTVAVAYGIADSSTAAEFQGILNVFSRASAVVVVLSSVFTLIACGLAAQRLNYQGVATACYKAILVGIVVAPLLFMFRGAGISCDALQVRPPVAATQRSTPAMSGALPLTTEWQAIHPPMGHVLRYSASVPIAQMRLIMLDGSRGQPHTFAPYSYPPDAQTTGASPFWAGYEFRVEVADPDAVLRWDCEPDNRSGAGSVVLSSQWQHAPGISHSLDVYRVILPPEGAEFRMRGANRRTSRGAIVTNDTFASILRELAPEIDADRFSCEYRIAELSQPPSRPLVWATVRTKDARTVANEMAQRPPTQYQTAASLTVPAPVSKPTTGAPRSAVVPGVQDSRQRDNAGQQSQTVFPPNSRQQERRVPKGPEPEVQRATPQLSKPAAIPENVRVVRDIQLREEDGMLTLSHDWQRLRPKTGSALKYHVFHNRPAQMRLWFRDGSHSAVYDFPIGNEVRPLDVATIYLPENWNWVAYEFRAAGPEQSTLRWYSVPDKREDMGTLFVANYWQRLQRNGNFNYAFLFPQGDVQVRLILPKGIVGPDTVVRNNDQRVLQVMLADHRNCTAFEYRAAPQGKLPADSIMWTRHKR